MSSLSALVGNHSLDSSSESFSTGKLASHISAAHISLEMLRVRRQCFTVALCRLFVGWLQLWMSVRGC